MAVIIVNEVKYPIVGHDYYGRVLVEFDSEKKYIDRADMIRLGAVMEVRYD